MAGEAKPKKSWRKTTLIILAMLFWTFASVIGSQLIVGLIMIPIVGEESFRTPVMTTVYSALSYILAMVLVIFVPPKFAAKISSPQKPEKKLKILNREELGLRGWPTWADVGLAPVGFIVQIILSMLLVGLFSLFPWFNAEEAQDVGYNILNGSLDRTVAFISLVVVAPIMEEVIFRGWLYGKLRQKLSGKTSEITGIIISILLVSLLFGIVHMQWNVGVNVFALSAVLCVLREITGTIYSGILVHMLKNGIAFYFLYVAGV